MFTLAHLSDPHLGPLPRPRLVELASKRAIGFLNWHRRRKIIHRGEILEPLVADLKAQSPDHIALTGDLVNIALPSEFSSSRVWLDKLGAARDVTFVPGNHDFYIRRTAREPHSHWGDFMRGDGSVPGEFPFLRRRGPLALIGLSPLFMATGMLGDAQLARLAALLERLSSEDLFRVVLIHHPPVSKPIHRFKRLLDSADLREILKARGADLVLHGHDHLHSVVYLDGPKGKIPAIGVPSASAAGGEEDPAAYNLYRMERAKGGWRCEAITRGFRRGQDAIGELTRRMLIDS
jgi:3',5'-cyclic AMP phosphodiesterase CpdA